MTPFANFAWRAGIAVPMNPVWDYAGGVDLAMLISTDKRTRMNITANNATIRAKRFRHGRPDRGRPARRNS